MDMSLVNGVIDVMTTSMLIPSIGIPIDMDISSLGVKNVLLIYSVNLLTSKRTTYPTLLIPSS